MPQSKTVVDQICSRRSGLIGGVVRRIGRRMIDRSKREIDAAVEQITKEMIEGEIDHLAKELLSELNQTTKFEESVTQYFPETASWVYHLATAERFLLAGAGPRGARFPDLPEAEPKALVELWFRTTPLEAMMLQMLVPWKVAYELLREFLPDHEAKQIAEAVTLESKDGWSVIRVGRPGGTEIGSGPCNALEN